MMVVRAARQALQQDIAIDEVFNPNIERVVLLYIGARKVLLGSLLGVATGLYSIQRAIPRLFVRR